MLCSQLLYPHTSNCSPTPLQITAKTMAQASSDTGRVLPALPPFSREQVSLCAGEKEGSAAKGTCEAGAFRIISSGQPSRVSITQDPDLEYRKWAH